MVVGPNEKRLSQCLDQFKYLCDDVVIATNNADQKTKNTIKKYDYHQYEDNREWGIFQPKIKTGLLQRIGGLKPDVILPRDADELYDSSFGRAEVESLSAIYPACYFYIVNLWNDEQHQKRSLGFWNIRMFNWKPELGTVYLKKNLHCGLGPPWTYKFGSHIPHLIKHYGLMDKEDRMRKVDRYDKYDPKAIFKDRIYYDTLKSDSTGTEFNEEDFKKKLDAEVNSYGNQQKTITPDKMKHEYSVIKRTRLENGEEFMFEVETKTVPNYLAQSNSRLKFECMGAVQDLTEDIEKMFEEPEEPIIEVKPKVKKNAKK